MLQQRYLVKLLMMSLALLFFSVTQFSTSAAVAAESGNASNAAALIPTRVELDQFPKEIVPNHNFTVAGTVSIDQLTSSDGENNGKNKLTSLPALTVGIYISPSTFSPEFSSGYYVVKVGQAATRPDGKFSATVTTPPADGVVVPLGNFTLSVQVESSGDLLSSWSPRYHIFLKSETVLKMNVFRDGGYLVIFGKLEDDSGHPVTAVPVKILLNDHSTGVISTGFDGSYETRIRVSSNDYSRLVKVSSIFPGTQQYRPIAVTQDFQLSSTAPSFGPFSGSNVPQSLPAFGAGVGLGLVAALGLAFVFMRRPVPLLRRQPKSTMQSSAVEQSLTAPPESVPQITEEERSGRAIDALANKPTTDTVKGAYGEIRRYLATTLLPESKSMTPRELLELVKEKTPYLLRDLTELTVMFESVNYKRQDSLEIDGRTTLDAARRILTTRSG